MGLPFHLTLTEGWQEDLVPLGKLLFKPQGSTADHVGRCHVLGQGQLGGLLQQADGGGVLRVHLYDLHAPLPGQGVNLLQQGPIGEAVLLAAEAFT